MTQVWQIGAGAAGRFYSDIFFEHDVMLLGPGQFGPYDPARYTTEIWPNKSSLHCLRRLHTEIQDGDIVIARHGHRVEGIGVATGEYEYHNAFDDIHGWDLQHTRRVIWQDHLRIELEALQKAEPLFSHMKQIPSLTRLNNDPVREKIAYLFPMIQNRELRTAPKEPERHLSIEQIGEALFAEGLPNDAVDKVVQTIIRQRRLLNWYAQAGQGRPTEHEVVAHMVLPLLLALGWSEQLLAVEWNKIDLAIFGHTPTNRDTCTMVCEAKTAGHGLQDVKLQAFNYAEKLNLIHCRKVLLSEGGRFYLYNRTGDLSSDLVAPPIGYLNIRQLRRNHFCPSGTDAIKTLMNLTPAGVAR